MSPYVKFTRGSSVVRRSMIKVSVNFSCEGARPNAAECLLKNLFALLALK